MTARTFAISQVGRMACLAYFPSAGEAKKELVDTLVACTDGNKHAKRTVDHIIESVTEVPHPAEIRRVAAELRPPRTSTACAKCNPPGFIHFLRGGLACSALCDCHPGKGVTDK